MFYICHNLLSHWDIIYRLSKLYLISISKVEENWAILVPTSIDSQVELSLSWGWANIDKKFEFCCKQCFFVLLFRSCEPLVLPSACTDFYSSHSFLSLGLPFPFRPCLSRHRNPASTKFLFLLHLFFSTNFLLVQNNNSFEKNSGYRFNLAGLFRSNW